MPTSTADEFCDAHPQLMTSHVLRLFYSPAIRSNAIAKTQFVAPDLATLPVPKPLCLPGSHAPRRQETRQAAGENDGAVGCNHL